MNPINVLKSNLDASVNFIQRFGRKTGLIEARFVQKKPDYISCYVSSHSGCVMGCKMCFLTQNGNTTFDHVDIPNYCRQIRTVLDFYKKNKMLTANRCNINFMSRGEPLANKHLINNYPQLYRSMSDLCQEYDLTMKPNISTIMPYTMKDRPLAQIFKNDPAYLYYSLYSLNPDFRKKWLPKAMPPDLALMKLKDFQNHSNHILTFHWSVIKDENDSFEEAKKMTDLLNRYNFKAKFQIVRFNAHPKLTYREADFDRIQEIFGIINAGLGNSEKSYIVPRVGRDVYASCGTFINDLDL